jgi:RNA polymerase sigma-70 factor (ECF subfamily)
VTADDGVVARAKAGDPDAWRELYVAHAGRLVVWLGTLPSGDAAASPEDLAADAWLTAANRITAFNGSSTEFAGWLFGIARNVARNARRRTARRATVPDTLEDPGYAPVVDSVEVGAVTDDWLRGVLIGLPPREREIVACIDVVGLGVAETAAALGVSAIAVRVGHHRALARLRRSGTLD